MNKEKSDASEIKSLGTGKNNVKIETVSELIKSLWLLPPGWKICASNRAAGKVYDIERVVAARFEADQNGRSEGVILIDFVEWEEEPSEILNPQSYDEE